MNANWVASPDGEDGKRETLIVTEDYEKHVMNPSPERPARLLRSHARTPCLCGIQRTAG